jgi:hypothetical protein
MTGPPSALSPPDAGGPAAGPPDPLQAAPLPGPKLIA